MATKIVKTLKFPNSSDEYQINAVKLGGKTLAQIEAEIPALPDFTDTNTTYDLAASKNSTDGNVKINLTASGSGSGTDSVIIKGSGDTSVTTDADGVITISSTEIDDMQLITVADIDTICGTTIVDASSNSEVTF